MKRGPGRTGNPRCGTALIEAYRASYREVIEVIEIGDINESAH